MKYLVLFSALLFAQVSVACVDLSGKYRSSEDQSIYELRQEGCSKLSMIDSEGTSELLTDGAERLFYTSDIEMGGVVIGTIEVYLRANFEGNGLVLNQKMVMTVQGQSSETNAKMTTTLMSNGNIQTVSEEDGRAPVTTIDQRVQ